MADPNTTPWYASRTLWVNVLAIAAMIAQGITGKEVINMELQATVLGVVNIILRLVTKTPVVWS